MNAPRNPNYAATVVALDKFVDLPNCDNVKGALIFGNHIIVSKDAPAGQLGLFFPAETQLSQEFLANNNLFRKPELGNVDPTQKGFFEHHGRVKTMKFRGHKSEGFWVPLNSLLYIPGAIGAHAIGESFDFIGDHEICRKYIPKGNRSNGAVSTRSKVAKLADSIVDGQFRFHYDTENLRRNIHKILPTDLISITDKWHGTSAVFSKVLVKRKLSILERAARFLGVKVQESVYGLTYSSRRVIKAVNGVEKNNNHFYTEDIWGIVAKEIEPDIPNGFTIYGEIVGFTPSGEPIQKDYSYGLNPGAHLLAVYRVTHTNVDGQVVELLWPQVLEFCGKRGLYAVPTLYYGCAKDLLPYSNYGALDSWQLGLLGMLEARYAHDADCNYNLGLPAEGVVVRIDRLEESEAFKLKNFRFLERESKQLDTGEIDVETAESEEVAA